MTSHLTASPDVIASHLDGEAVLLHMGSKSYFRLNRTGAHIWKCIEGGAGDEAIVQSLVSEFDVTSSDASAAYASLRHELLASNLASLSDS